MSKSVLDSRMARVQLAAEALAEAKVRYANGFILNKMPTNGVPVTDGYAHQLTVSQTQDELTVLQSEYDVAMLLLQQEVTNAEPA